MANGTAALEKNNGENQEVAKREGTMSERFTAAVVKEFSGVAGSVQLTPYQKRLAQHLFLKIDAALQEAEVKRSDRSKPTITWANINMTKLATDAMHRIDLGLDALIPATIYPIPYLNGRTGKYNLDLRIGYKGEDLYRRNMAADIPKDIRYELVYSNDTFRALKKNPGRPVESYEFEVSENAFDRGEVVGGFGYIEYDDPTKNVLVLVTDKDFKKSEAKAGSDMFWGPYREEMQYKTIVHRTTAKLQMDPQKVNAAFLAVQREADVIDAEVVATAIQEHANTGPVLEFPGGSVSTGEQQPPVMVACPDAPGEERTVEYCNASCKKREGCPSHEAQAQEMKKRPSF